MAVCAGPAQKEREKERSPHLYSSSYDDVPAIPTISSLLKFTHKKERDIEKVSPIFVPSNGTPRAVTDQPPHQPGPSPLSRRQQSKTRNVACGSLRIRDEALYQILSPYLTLP